MKPEILIKIRKKKGLTQEKLSHKAGISYNTLIKIENKLILDPRISTLIKLADILEVSLDELVGREFKSSKNIL